MQKISAVVDLVPVKTNHKFQVFPGAVQLVGKFLRVHPEFEDIGHRAKIGAHRGAY